MHRQWPYDSDRTPACFILIWNYPAPKQTWAYARRPIPLRYANEVPHHSGFGLLACCTLIGLLHWEYCRNEYWVGVFMCKRVSSCINLGVVYSESFQITFHVGWNDWGEININKVTSDLCRLWFLYCRLAGLGY